jgi:hypothetical protein
MGKLKAKHSQLWRERHSGNRFHGRGMDGFILTRTYGEGLYMAASTGLGWNFGHGTEMDCKSVSKRNPNISSLSKCKFWIAAKSFRV